jgi:hypothetical protein
MSGLLCQVTTKVFILKAADVVFAPGNGLKQQLIVWIKEIESGDGSVVVFGGTGKFLELVVSRTGIVDAGDEFEIPTIGCSEKLAQCRKAVNGFLHGSPLGFSASITMFYLTVVFEKVTSLTVVSMRRMRENLSYILMETGPMVCLMRVPSMRMLKRFPISS